MTRRRTGRRIGSGIFDDPKAFSFQLEKSDFEILDATADRQHIATGELIRRILRGFLAAQRR